MTAATTPRRATGPSESGTVTLWLLGVCMLLFALGGISVDLWRGFSARRSLANAADAAALAGASAIDEEAYRRSGSVQLDPVLAESRARAHVAGQLDAGALRDVAVHADRDAVTVVVRGEIGFTLLRVVDPGGDLAVRVTAIATPARRMTRLIGALVLALAVVGLAPPAAAQTAGGGELGPDSVRATAADFGAGTFPGGGLPAAAPAVESPYTWERAGTGGRCVVFAGAVPPELAASVSPLPGLIGSPAPVQIGTLQGARPGAVRLDGTAPLPPGAELVGTFVIDSATPRDGGPNGFFVPRCAAPGDPLPPAPPDAASIWQQTPLPRAHIQASPPGTRDWPGIVNLGSRFWGEPLPDARATVTIDGYVVDVAAHPVAYGWAFDDGTTSVGSSPGSSADPVRATYRRRGDHGLTLYVTWAGLAHITAPALGLDFGMQYLGTVTLPVAVTHHVAEIRALLRSR